MSKRMCVDNKNTLPKKSAITVVKNVGWLMNNYANYLSATLMILTCDINNKTQKKTNDL